MHHPLEFMNKVYEQNLNNVLDESQCQLCREKAQPTKYSTGKANRELLGLFGTESLLGRMGGQDEWKKTFLQAFVDVSA